jgi:catechol-2,3-dioxygenase
VAIAVKVHDKPLPGEFDERRVGLDHISFQVADRDELQQWVEHLEAKGIAHSGIKETDLGPLVVFRDPDNIQIELFVHPTAEEVMRLLNAADSTDSQRPTAASIPSPTITRLTITKLTPNRTFTAGQDSNNF